MSGEVNAQKPVEDTLYGQEIVDVQNNHSDEVSVEKKNEINGNKMDTVDESLDNIRKKSVENGKRKNSGKQKKIPETLVLQVETTDTDIQNGDQGRQPALDEIELQQNGINPSVDDQKDFNAENRNGKPTAKDETDDGMKEIDDEIIDREAIIIADGKDETDAASVMSLYMMKDLRYYFQHPYCRLFIAYFVTFCNFLIYAEDPVAHSVKECTIPLIGNDFAFVCTRYPPSGWSLLKVLLWLAAMIVGCILGKLLIHKLLLNKLLKLEMFNRCQGSWMIMFMFVLISLFVFSWIYNGFLMIGGADTEDYRISDLMGLSNSIFMKMAATGTWCGDFFTAWMVTDMMLQEKLYPHWAKPVRKWWNNKYNRVILFWIVVVVTSFVVIFVIATDYIKWDKLNRDLLPSNEVSRSFLASFILVMDLLIVMQDWDFPHFMSNIDIKLPGLNTSQINFKIPKCLRKDHWHVHITGKWFNYGILIIVMILDLNMWKNQIFYKPYDFGQYVDGEGKIHTVLDDYSLKNFNESQLTHEYRNATINPSTNQTFISGDGVMNSRYYNVALSIKGVAFIPSILGFVIFGLLIWFFGRTKPTEEDPYGGRLLKRRKKVKFSFKNFRDSFRRKMNLRRKVQAVPKLLKFTNRRNTGNRQNLSNNDGEMASYPEN